MQIDQCGIESLFADDPERLARRIGRTGDVVVHIQQLRQKVCCHVVAVNDQNFHDSSHRKWTRNQGVRST
jgi:hypothetical protein